jgi:hypothetical protein
VPCEPWLGGYVIYQWMVLDFCRRRALRPGAVPLDARAVVMIHKPRSDLHIPSFSGFHY